MLSAKKFYKLSLKSQVRWLLSGLQELRENPEPEALQNFYSLYLEPIIAAHSSGSSTANSLNSALGHSLQQQWRLCCHSPQEQGNLKRNFGELEQLLRQLCALEPSDWTDWTDELEGQEIEALQVKQYPLYLYLDRVRSPFNVGSLFRSAAALGAKGLWLHEHCPSLVHPRARRSAMGAIDLLPAWRCNEPQREPQLAAIPWLGLETGELALRYGAHSLKEFAFPQQGGLLLVGAEDTGLRPELLEYCSSTENRQRGGALLSIPMSGLKSSLNLGVAAAIVLQRWVEVLGATGQL